MKISRSRSGSKNERKTSQRGGTCSLLAVLIPMTSTVLVVLAMPSYLTYVTFLFVMIAAQRDPDSDIWSFLLLAVRGDDPGCLYR